MSLTPMQQGELAAFRVLRESILAWDDVDGVEMSVDIIVHILVTAIEVLESFDVEERQA